MTPAAPAAQDAPWRWPWQVGRSMQGFLMGWLALLLMVVEGLQWSLWPTSVGAVAGWFPLVKIGGLLLAMGWLVYRSCAPIRRLTESLVEAEPGQGVDAQPRELAALAASVQRLLRRQQDTVDQQRKFLADASHQLRTPFAVLRTQLQGALSGQLDVRETLPRMLATVDRSSELVRQLLSQAKVEQLVHQGDWQEVDLAAVAREVCLEFAPLLARKRLDFSLQAVPVRLRTDPWLLGELLRNLMSNAIHHSAKGAALGMLVRVLPQETELLVWDNGGGIDEALRERLFEPFQSASGGTGIGLGLSICRQIAQSMQAEVDLFNRVQDQRVIGVDAVVRWPRVAVATGAATAPPAPQAWADLASQPLGPWSRLP